jgi:hypothetical protein
LTWKMVVEPAGIERHNLTCQRIVCAQARAGLFSKTLLKIHHGVAFAI